MFLLYLMLVYIEIDIEKVRVTALNMQIQNYRSFRHVMIELCLNILWSFLCN